MLPRGTILTVEGLPTRSSDQVLSTGFYVFLGEKWLFCEDLLSRGDHGWKCQLVPDPAGLHFVLRSQLEVRNVSAV